MTITWFRLHHKIFETTKFKRLSPTDRYSYLHLYYLASKDKERGSITELDDDDIAYELGIGLEDWQTLKSKLKAKGFIDFSLCKITITNWNEEQYASDSSTERVKKHREKKMKRFSNVSETFLKHDVTSPDTDPDSEQIQNRADADPKQIQKETLSPSSPPQTQNAERERENASLLKKENPEKPAHNPLAQLKPDVKAAFLKFCKQHYEANNPGKHLALAQEYAKKYFDELWELFQNSIAPTVNLEPSCKNEETAIAICENFPVEQWPQWIVKFVPHTGEYYKRFEAFMMQPRK